jgi:hypothetical protein
MTAPIASAATDDGNECGTSPINADNNTTATLELLLRPKQLYPIEE